MIEVSGRASRVIALVSMGQDRHHIDLLFDEIYIGSTARLHYVVINGYDAVTDRFTYTNTDGDVRTWVRREFLRHWNWHDDFTGGFGEVAETACPSSGCGGDLFF